jgi:energy-converting hydrogenase Eha subunit A
VDSTPAPASAGPPPVRPARWGAGAPWPGRAELRADLRGSLVLAGVLLLAGVPSGLLWWALAPRATFEVTADGPVPVGHPSAELLVADDGVYTLVLAGLGLVAGLVAWRLRRRRGVATVLALAVGTVLASLVAWQLGELLGAGPSPAELAAVGTQVITPLRLGSPAALAVASFLAVLAYVVSTLLTAAEDLDRPDPAPARPPAGGPLLEAETSESGASENEAPEGAVR